MKAIKLASFFLLIGLSTSVFAQKMSWKNAKSKLPMFPVIPVQEYSTYKIQIYPGEIALEQDNLKVRKGLKSKLQGFQDNVNNIGADFYTFKQFTYEDISPDVLIEIAFGEFVLEGKTMVSHEIPCTYKGAKLNKDNIMVCDAYYYLFDYELPVILRIKDRDGNVVYAEKYAERDIVNWGKDESGLSGYLRKEELETAFGKVTDLEAEIAPRVAIPRILRFNESIDKCFYFYDEEWNYAIISGRGSFDYPELDRVQEEAVANYKALGKGKGEGSVEKIREHIKVWEAALGEMDENDKNARISNRIGMGLHETLSDAYLTFYDFDKALEHVDEAIRLQQNVTNKSREEGMHIYRKTLLEYKTRYAGSDLTNVDLSGTRLEATSILLAARVKEKDATYKFLAGGMMYPEFEKDYDAYAQKFHKEEVGTTVELADGVTMDLSQAISESTGSKTYKERIMGSMLILNDAWGDNMSVVDPEVCALTELTQLNITDQSELNSLPGCIGDLSNLTKLNLWNNSLTSLPAEIGKLENLEVLDISNNKITELPAELKNCKKLKKLVIKGNNISNLDEITSAFGKLKVK